MLTVYSDQLWIAFKLVSLQCTNNFTVTSPELVAVVNCFQISIFAVHEQQDGEMSVDEYVVNCFQISIFAVHEQPLKQLANPLPVVNCFQISIFAVHEQLR